MRSTTLRLCFVALAYLAVLLPPVQAEPDPVGEWLRLQGWRRVGPDDPLNVAERMQHRITNSKLPEDEARAIASELIRYQGLLNENWHTWEPVASALFATKQFPDDLAERFWRNSIRVDWPIKQQIPAGARWPWVVNVIYRGADPEADRRPDAPISSPPKFPVVIGAVRGPWIEGQLESWPEATWETLLQSFGKSSMMFEFLPRVQGRMVYLHAPRVSQTPGGYRVALEVDWSVPRERFSPFALSELDRFKVPLSGTARVERTVDVTPATPPGARVERPDAVHDWLSGLAWRIRLQGDKPMLFVTSFPDGADSDRYVIPPDAPMAMGFRVRIKTAEKDWLLGEWWHSPYRWVEMPWFAVPQEVADLMQSTGLAGAALVFEVWPEAIDELARDGEVVYAGPPIEFAAPRGPLVPSRPRSFMLPGGTRFPEASQPFGPAFDSRFPYRR
jgi:hypothetical protein